MENLGTWERSKIGNPYDHWAIYDSHGETVCITVNGEHNAKIIEASPDLLAACEHAAMSEHHPACARQIWGHQCTCHVKKCQDAIAKTKTD